MSELPRCKVCGKQKKPRGRHAPPEMAGDLCWPDCPGYASEPKPTTKWPEEVDGE